MMITISAALGTIVGLILALTGAGGAILAVPLLVFFLQLSIEQAAPIALLAVGISAALGASMGLRAGIVRYRAAMLMSITGMCFSPMGLWIAHRTPNSPLTLIFAITLAFVAFRMLKPAKGNEPANLHSDQSPPPCQLDLTDGRFIWNASCARALAISGVVAGFLSGLLGVGGGFVIVPALRKATNAPMHSIIATSLAVIALVSTSGVISSAVAGRMDWQISLPFAAGAMSAMLAGRHLASRMSQHHLQRGFALVTAVVAVGMVVKTIQIT
jgi:uncharacterized protein